MRGSFSFPAGAALGIMMWATREGVLPSIAFVALAVIFSLALGWREEDPKILTRNLLAFCLIGLVVEALLNCYPALSIEDPVLANTVVLVGVGDALVGQLAVLPLALVSGFISSLVSSL